jgi:hypothetical protein
MSTPTFGLPNVNVPVQQVDGFVNPAWYLYFTQLRSAVGPDASGVTSIIAGEGLATNVAGGTITSSGTLSLNLDYFGNTEGTILYRGPAAWEGLPPGEENTYLQSNGSGQAPSWAGVEEILPTVVPGDILGNAGAEPQPAQDVTLSSILDIAVGNIQGMIVFRGPEVWQALDPGNPNQILTSGGPGYNVFWADSTALNVARYLASPVVVSGTRTIQGISTDGSQNFGLSTGFGV